MQKKPILHLLMGLPGSGKSTLAQYIERLSGAVRLTSDEYRLMLFPKPTFDQDEHDLLYTILDKNVETLLAFNRSVIYDANLNRHIHRQEKYDLARACNADVMVWWLTTPDNLSKQRRLDDQNTVLIPQGETPEQLFSRVAGVFEPPHADEKFAALDGSHIDELTVKKLLESQK